MDEWRIECVFDGEGSASKVGRALLGHTGVLSVGLRSEHRLAKGEEKQAVALLCVRVASREAAAAITDLVRARHEDVAPEISLIRLHGSSDLAEVSEAKGEKKASVAFSTPLNEAMLSPISAATYRTQYVQALFFPHMRLENLFNEELLEDVYDALAAAGNFETRSNDLYLFSQSQDLRSLGEQHPRIAELATALYSKEMILFLSQITNIPLSNQVDMSATLYTKSCHLLPHDDRLSTRRVAFILYLVPRMWREKDGGFLRFFGSVGEPPNPEVTLKEDYVPVWGNFAFFSVGAKSFHTVTEVTSEMPRLAISGWYHGPALTEPQLQPVFFPPLSTPAPLLPSPQFSLNSQYLNSDTQIQITKKLRKKGAISLADFLDLRFLNSFPFSECAWTNCGPLHLRSYQRCVNPTGKIHAIQSVLLSTQFRDFVTGLSGTELEVESWEIRRFLRGEHYTLLHDALESEKNGQNEEIVEACFTLLPQLEKSEKPEDDDWDLSWGGYVSVIDGEGGEELLIVCPVNNSITITIAEPGVKSFVKFLSAYAISDRVDFVARFRMGAVVESMQMELSSDSDSEEEGGDEDEREQNKEHEENPSKKCKH